jgi:DNA gyrase inhibitor GyrI
MGEVIQFPRHDTARIDQIQEAFREALSAKGISGELMEFALARFEHHRQKLDSAGRYTFELSLPSSMKPDEIETLKQQIDGGMKQVSGEHIVQLYKLVVDLVFTELEAKALR